MEVLITEWIQATITKVVDHLVELRERERNARLLNREEVAKLLNVDKTTFDKHYRHLEGFPRELPTCKWSLPAVIRWIEEQD